MLVSLHERVIGQDMALLSEGKIGEPPMGTPWDPHKPPEPKTLIFVRFFKGWSQKH